MVIVFYSCGMFLIIPTDEYVLGVGVYFISRIVSMYLQDMFALHAAWDGLNTCNTKSDHRILEHVLVFFW